MKNVSTFLLLSLILFCSFGYAQVQSTVLDTRNKLETEIQKNLTDLIATRLNKSKFTVAVRVPVKELPSGKKKEENKKNDNLPAGMDIGAIDVREVLASYEKQLEEIRLLKEEGKENENPKFEAYKIEVFVGLDESFDDKYVNEFKIWLANRVKLDYGTFAKSEVNRVKLEPNQDGLSNPDREPSKKDFLRFLSPVVSAFLLLIGLIFMGLLVKSGLNVVGTGKKELAMEPKGELAVKGMGAPGLEAVQNTELPVLPEPVQRIKPRDLEHVLGKIAFVCMELGKRVNELVRVWIDSGDEGYVKAALLIDTMLAAREKIMSETGTLPALQIPLDADIVDSREENLSEGYRQVSTMMDFERFKKLEEIYWDLISVKTLGLQSLRRPFDFLQSLNSLALLEVLQPQRDETKALALMYLPTEAKTEYLNLVDESEKEKIIFQMLNNSHVTQKQIWDLDTAVKVTLLNQGLQSIEKLVNLFPRTVEVLQTLDALGEIRMLKKICPGLPEQGLIVKQQYTTLAFIYEWKPEYVRRLISVATGNEIVILIKTIPEAKEVVLASCTDKVRLIVEDDLKIATQTDERESEKAIRSLKSKWLKISSNENIPMSKVIEQGKKLEEKNAA